MSRFLLEMQSLKDNKSKNQEYAQLVYLSPPVTPNDNNRKVRCSIPKPGERPATLSFPKTRVEDNGDGDDLVNVPLMKSLICESGFLLFAPAKMASRQKKIVSPKRNWRFRRIISHSLRPNVRKKELLARNCVRLRRFVSRA
ncbi:hypothetical protein GWI33_004911 [Rhynchophorus ferrugineus]|uniref:Uncharacterized protein n=1 Tax=Rhynchophorus ferrugineus TaxID=354439 RepID=A0A834INV1_RHYFE|nr:hypothetical protein GWI33_004911 [Rhynchophorus ferrugineus]